ncbi:MAG: hypothetical protein WC222_11335 [Parachlamydiales bacterium]|jgi:hypothetical protein
MTLEQIINDIRLILRATTDDSRIVDSHLLRKILNYRSLFIIDSFLQTGTFNTQWIQRLGNKSLTSVGSADNSNIPEGTLKFGKVTLPNVIPVGPERGIYRISDTQRQKQIYHTTWPMLTHMIAALDTRINLFRYYANIGDEYYIYPYVSEVDVMLILDNPLNGYSFSTELIVLTDIEDGVEYFVISGTVKEVDGAVITIHSKGSSFTGSSTSVYSGDGKIREYNQIVTEAYNNEFYIDSGMAQRIVLEILTKDFAIERQSISDIVNDSQDQTKILTS